MLKPILSIEDEVKYLYDEVPELKERGIPSEILEKIIGITKYYSNLSLMSQKFLNVQAVEIAKHVRILQKIMERLPISKDTKTKVLKEIMETCIPCFGYNHFKVKRTNSGQKIITFEDFLKGMEGLGKTKIKDFITGRDLVGEIWELLRPYYRSDYDTKLVKTIWDIIHTTTGENYNVKSRIQSYLEQKERFQQTKMSYSWIN
jgi:hypothetical protein